VPSVFGKLTVIADRPDGLLVVKNTGRRMKRGRRSIPLKGRALLVRLRPFASGDYVLSSYHLAAFEHQVMEIVAERPLSDLFALVDEAFDKHDLVEPAGLSAAKRHRWNNGDTCLDCGLRREGAGAGPYGSMRYYRDEETGAQYKPGPCKSAHRL